MPKFSIVIPTRARADTLLHALRTAVDQQFDDLEILVHESGDDCETAQVIATIGDHRTRHIKTVSPVSMTENWERALQSATGEYVTFVGDDDGLLPDACIVAVNILDRNSSELLSWRPACYFWPKYVGIERRDRLLLNLDQPSTLEVKRSHTALEMLYRCRIDYSCLPMIYNSFVKRSLIERVRARCGRYFLGSAPDVTSGIVNAFFWDTFLLTGRPLSCSGLSHNSTGHRMFFTQEDSLREAATAEAFASASNRAAPARNLKLFIGDEMLAVKRTLFPQSRPVFDHKNFFWAALQELNREPSQRASRLAELRGVAESRGISIEEWVSAPQRIAAAPPAGVRAISSQRVAVEMDCSRVGIENIYQATRLVSALVPPSDSQAVVWEQSPLDSIPMRRRTTISFNATGNGILFLSYGWGECEGWGVWSLGSSAEVVLLFAERPKDNLEILIRGRMFVHAGHPQSCGAVRCNGKQIASFSASVAKPDISIGIGVPKEDLIEAELVLSFRIENPHSPAEDGLSSDIRRLGLGLEEIAISWR